MKLLQSKFDALMTFGDVCKIAQTSAGDSHSTSGSPHVLVIECQDGDKSHRRNYGHPDSSASQPSSLAITILRSKLGSDSAVVA